MPIYEIINPSDACTIEAPDDKTAVATVALLGEGAYGARRCDNGACILSVGLFGFPGEIIDHFGPGLPDESAKNLAAWVEENKNVVAAAFESFCYGDDSERAFLVEAMAQAKDPAKVKAAHEDRRRSSLNNIGKRAASYAAHLRAKAA